MSKSLKLIQEPLQSPEEEKAKMGLREMTAQQRRFCMAYLTNGFRPSEAARTAGYAENFVRNAANVVLNRPSVKYFLRQKIAEMTLKDEVTFEWKLKKLKRCADETIPDNENEKCVIADMNVGIKAIDLMNKMQGDYAPINVHQASFNTNVEVDEERAQQLIDQFEKDY